ncbi:tyrosine-type recombinase/integrase [Streptococcus uberis]|uniref:tyrosine-type recombinase/integrase n=1 Tax=Streptococcus uberis TaxID=1349 RepID=UPI0012B61D96|nr:site-specific integrase [Streptococcus uberis]MTB36801.1 tyrosine-type recombinase/integrase [Streptococcus uberis]MTB57783.1 tyrosine-type recombinase/integrase [Streptococcus uberis]
MSTIEKRGKKSFRARVSITEHGKQKQISKTFKTKAEAKLWAQEQEILKGKGKNISGREDSFADFFETWVYSIKKNDVRQATFINYERTVSIIKSLFKDIKLKNLDDLIVQKKIDEYGLTHSRKTTTELLLKIRTSLHYAYARGLLENDFGTLVKPRGKELEKRNKALSISEMKILRNYLLNHIEDEFNILALIALETGARRGEILGLKLEDISQDGIHIKRSISPTNNDTSLKTKKSERTVAITQELFEILQKLTPKSNGYLFETDGFKQSQRLKKLLKELNLTETTFHGLRDTLASFLFSNDIRLDYVSKILGHSNLQTTMNYYLELMPEKKHQQEADALKLLSSLSQ